MEYSVEQWFNCVSFSLGTQIWIRDFFNRRISNIFFFLSRLYFNWICIHRNDSNLWYWYGMVSAKRVCLVFNAQEVQHRMFDSLLRMKWRSRSQTFLLASFCWHLSTVFFVKCYFAEFRAFRNINVTRSIFRYCFLSPHIFFSLHKTKK